jgi:hypothetical protein
MQKNQFLFFVSITALLLISDFKLAAQDSTGNSLAVTTKKIIHPMNFIKINLTAIFLKNYSLQYERILNRKFSFAVAYRTMPSTTLPFKSYILKSVGDDDPQTAKTIEDFRLSNSAITPEIRFYASKKGYGRGFYIAAFYRYASFKSNDVNIFYSDDAGGDNSIKLSGKITANTGGILLGVQQAYGKHFVLDLWLLGPHYGSGKGDFSGISSTTLSATEQESLKKELDGIDLPLTNKTVAVNANGASVKLSGPWGGIRAGISVGLRF